MRRTVQIDEKIAAGEKVHLRKWCIGQDVMRRKHHQITNVLLDPITAVFLGKKPLQACRREVPGDADRIEAGASRFNSPAVQVRCKNLQGEPELLLCQIFLQHNGERIGFLSGGTAGDP